MPLKKLNFWTFSANTTLNPYRFDFHVGSNKNLAMWGLHVAWFCLCDRSQESMYEFVRKTARFRAPQSEWFSIFFLSDLLKNWESGRTSSRTHVKKVLNEKYFFIMEKIVVENFQIWTFFSNLQWVLMIFT